ncbi:MAG TPA: hypothetical protein VHL58_18535 [Thermoanaerobaculia bacterium]|nr:hypothetical protein [Thermoanaerobaculia bacterium]
MTSNNRRLRKGVLAFGLLAGLSPLSMRASIARAVPFEEKVTEAESIVVGHCLKTRSAYDPSGKWIVTYSTFRIDKAIKGEPAAELTVVTPGGSVGSIHQETVGIPHFRQGDDNLLFIKRQSLGPSVLYFDQGTYTVDKDDRGETIVEPIASDLVLIDSQAGKAVSAEMPRRTLHQFESDVQVAIKDHRIRIASEGLVRPRPNQKSVELLGPLRQFLKNNGTLLLLVTFGLALSTVALIRRR